MNKVKESFVSYSTRLGLDPNKPSVRRSYESNEDGDVLFVDASMNSEGNAAKSETESLKDFVSRSLNGVKKAGSSKGSTGVAPFVLNVSSVRPNDDTMELLEDVTYVATLKNVIKVKLTKIELDSIKTSMKGRLTDGEKLDKTEIPTHQFKALIEFGANGKTAQFSINLNADKALLLAENLEIGSNFEQENCSFNLLSIGSNKMIYWAFNF